MVDTNTSSSFLDVEVPEAPISPIAPLKPITSDLPELGAYSTNINLKKPTSILPALLSTTFNIPQVNVNTGDIVGDFKESVSDLELPSFDEVEEKAEKEGLDPVEWVEENIVKPIDQTFIRPVDEIIEEKFVDPTTEFIKTGILDPLDEKIVTPIDELIGEQLVDPTTKVVKNILNPAKDFLEDADDYIDAAFSGFTTPEVLEDLKAAGGKYLDAAENINDFVTNPNSATALEFVKGIDTIYATITGSDIPQTMTMPEIDIEGTGVTGGEEIQVSNILSPEAVKNFQSVAGVYNIANYIDNPTIEGAAAAYGDLLHLSSEYSPEVYEILGADTAVNVVGELANIVKVIDAIEALEGGVDDIGEALTITSGISAGAATATTLGLATEGGIVSQIGGLAGPLAIASLAHMAYQLTKDEDFPRSFASLDYDPEHTYQSGFYVSSQTGPEFIAEQEASGTTSYAFDAQAGKNYGGYGPFKYGEGRAIDGGSRTKPDSALMASQEFANWMVTGLGYQVDEAAFKKFTEDGSNFIGDGDIGYLQVRHGYKGIKKDGYGLITDMIKKGVFVATDDTIVLDSEDWSKSLTHLKESSNNPSSFLYKKLSDISDPLRFAPAEVKEQIKIAEQQAAQAQKEAEKITQGYLDNQKELKENPELAAEQIKNSYIEAVFNAEGSLQEKIPIVEGILAVDTSTLINSVFDPQKAISDAYSITGLGPNNPYTRLNESEYFAAKSPFGFSGTLPYIG